MKFVVTTRANSNVLFYFLLRSEQKKREFGQLSVLLIREIFDEVLTWAICCDAWNSLVLTPTSLSVALARKVGRHVTGCVGMNRMPIQGCDSTTNRAPTAYFPSSIFGASTNFSHLLILAVKSWRTDETDFVFFPTIYWPWVKGGEYDWSVLIWTACQEIRLPEILSDKPLKDRLQAHPSEI